MVKKKSTNFLNARFMKPTLSSEFKTSNKFEEHGTKQSLERHQNKGRNKSKKHVIRVERNVQPVVDPIIIPVNVIKTDSVASSRTTTTSEVGSIQRTKSVSSDDVEKRSAEHAFTDTDSGTGTVDTEVYATGINSKEIQAAQETCKQLREQINSLKCQQNEFLRKTDTNYVSTNCSEQNETFNGIKSNETSYQTIRYRPISSLIKKPDYSDRDQFESRLQNDDRPRPSGRPLHNSPTLPYRSYSTTDLSESSASLNTSVKSRHLKFSPSKSSVNSNKIIKKLYSEKQKYKSKVHELQNALNEIKKNTQQFKTPDIPAHSVTYYNADLIGEGRMCLVYSGTIYETKKAAIKKIVRPDMFSSSDRSYLVAEAGLLMTLHHQNIVQVYGVASSPLQPLLVMEMVTGVTLNDKIYSQSKLNGLSIAEYYRISRDICIGMTYLHSQKPPVLHLNLRPCNIFIDSDGKAKVADFGFSKIRLDSGASNRSSIPYLAPELLHFPVHLTTKLDVYSYAMVLWEMSTKTVPYKDLSLSQIMELINDGKRLSIPPSLTSGYHSLIQQCWNQSPLQRPTFKEVIITIETMILPKEWNDEIKKCGIKKHDMKDLLSESNVATPRATIPVYEHTTISPNICHSPVNRDKIVSDMNLDHDMKTMGYNMPARNGPTRSHSNAYKNIEKSLRKYQKTPSSPNKYQSSAAPVAPHCSPVKASLEEMSQVYGIKNQSFTNGLANEQPLESALSFTNHHRNGQVGISAPNFTHDSMYDQIPRSMHAQPTHNATSFPTRRTHSIINGGKDTDSTSVGDIASLVPPLPLTNRDLRYVDQDLNVETPKIIFKANPRTYEQSTNSLFSEEEIRTNGRIAPLRNESERRSEFDSKIRSYISDACESESRVANGGPGIGWRSSRSHILHKHPPSSGDVKVLSIATSEADKCFKNPQRNTASLSGTYPESQLTTPYIAAPETRQKLIKQIKESARENQGVDIVSSSLSQTSIDEDRRIAVLSHPSNTDLSFKSKSIQNDTDVSHSSSDSSTTIKNDSKTSSLRKSASAGSFRNSQGSKSSKKKNSKHRNSKLERSYTPEQQLMNGSGHSYGGFMEYAMGYPHDDGGVRRSASSDSIGRQKSKKPSRMKKSPMQQELPKPEVSRNGDGLTIDLTTNPEAVQSTDSIFSNDTINMELKTTARELSEASDALKEAAKMRRKSLN